MASGLGVPGLGEVRAFGFKRLGLHVAGSTLGWEGGGEGV